MLLQSVNERELPEVRMGAPYTTQTVTEGRNRQTRRASHEPSMNRLTHVFLLQIPYLVFGAFLLLKDLLTRRSNGIRTSNKCCWRQDDPRLPSPFITLWFCPVLFARNNLGMHEFFPISSSAPIPFINASIRASLNISFGRSGQRLQEAVSQRNVQFGII